jgi:hypothetical protein
MLRFSTLTRQCCGCQALTWTPLTMTRSISTVCQTNTCLFDVTTRTTNKYQVSVGFAKVFCSDDGVSWALALC